MMAESISFGEHTGFSVWVLVSYLSTGFICKTIWAFYIGASGFVKWFRWTDCFADP